MLAPSAADNLDTGETVTLCEFLKEQRQHELDAAAALPYRFDRCTWNLGPLRQTLYICACSATGQPRAFCYACAVTCHDYSPEESDGLIGAHRVREIGPRRNFLCDCPATGHCRLAPNLSVASHRNSYHQIHNFYGRYCFCDETESATDTRTMYQCVVCEDWFHEDCIAKQSGQDATGDFVCCDCVKQHSVLFQPSHHASLFLVPRWREDMRRLVSERALESHLQQHCISHLIRDEEPVYEPEVDADASLSLYECTQVMKLPRCSCS